MLRSLVGSEMCIRDRYEADTQGRRFRRDTRMMNVAHMAIGFCTLMYLATALWGYITFKDNTDKDLLDNYTDHMDNGFTAGLSTALCVSFVFTVPLIHFPHRRSLEQLLFRNRPFEWWRHILIGFTSIGVVLLLAIEVPQITEVFGAVGSTSSVTLVFILPALAFLKVEEGPWTSRKKLPAAIMMFAGGFVGVVSLGAFFVQHA
eukprot:TRINITY_DN2789_c0_g1_i4.p1 TRINITY_DN2789_c0_g1~~TRINITY_DN2789_c0_g1_i4.p1  ORF type:complete len:204 (-),score=63.30 TRINITY_DN2789_c0_g1_i4:326-937(-)